MAYREADGAVIDRPEGKAWTVTLAGPSLVPETARRFRLPVSGRPTRSILPRCPELDCVRHLLPPAVLALAELRAAEVGVGAREFVATRGLQSFDPGGRGSSKHPEFRGLGEPCHDHLGGRRRHCAVRADGSRRRGLAIEAFRLDLSGVDVPADARHASLRSVRRMPGLSRRAGYRSTPSLSRFTVRLRPLATWSNRCASSITPWRSSTLSSCWSRTITRRGPRWPHEPNRAVRNHRCARRRTQDQAESAQCGDSVCARNVRRGV